jgi:hypothetical protein
LHTPPHSNSGRRCRFYPQPQHAPHSVVTTTLDGAISTHAACRPYTIPCAALDDAMRMVGAGLVVAKVGVLDEQR